MSATLSGARVSPENPARDSTRRPLSSAQVGAIEFLADVLATSEEDGRAHDFYGRLAEATTSLTSLERAVIFRYDSARRRVRVATGSISTSSPTR